MNEILDRFLCERFPKLYIDRKAPMNRTAMCWGFSCGDGWFSLLFDLSERIDAALKTREVGFPEGTKATKEVRASSDTFRVVQVKEKFGTLRFYTSPSFPDIEELVREAERQSAVTCEECGAPGVLRGRNWFRTACEKHSHDELPVGCAITGGRCSKGTIGCAEDHVPEEIEP